MAYVVLMLCFGLAAAIIGKIKGSSFFIWFAIGFVVPVLGMVAAILYRYERHEPRRRCDDCGAVVPVTNQVCTRCGADLDFPSERLVPRGSVRA
jgi:membrane protein implicated in regulation of membrane protease activity